MIISFLISHIDWSRSLITIYAWGGAECGGMVWQYFFCAWEIKLFYVISPGGGTGGAESWHLPATRRIGVLMWLCQVEHSWAGALWLSGLKQILLTHNVVSQNHSKPISHASRFMSLFSTPPSSPLAPISTGYSWTKERGRRTLTTRWSWSRLSSPFFVMSK